MKTKTAYGAAWACYYINFKHFANSLDFIFVSCYATFINNKKDTNMTIDLLPKSITDALAAADADTTANELVLAHPTRLSFDVGVRPHVHELFLYENYNEYRHVTFPSRSKMLLAAAYLFDTGFATNDYTRTIIKLMLMLEDAREEIAALTSENMRLENELNRELKFHEGVMQAIAETKARMEARSNDAS
jgi:hypothetical protein